MRRRWVSGLLFSVALAGCDWPGQPNPADRPVLPDEVRDFQALYDRNCAGCHGADGALGPAPPLNDPLFIAIVPEHTLSRVVRNGRAGTSMPPFSRSAGGALTDGQIDVLVEGLRSHWKSDEPLPLELPAYTLTETDALASPDSRERGAEVFAQACAGCHGEHGMGVEHEGRVDHRINAPAFLGLISNQALRRIIITGRADLHMPNFAESDGREDDFQPLTSADIDDLVALIAHWRMNGDSD